MPSPRRGITAGEGHRLRHHPHKPNVVFSQLGAQRHNQRHGDRISTTSWIPFPSLSEHQNIKKSAGLKSFFILIIHSDKKFTILNDNRPLFSTTTTRSTP